MNDLLTNYQISVNSILNQAADLKIRKLMGHSYLQNSRVKDALEIYTGILNETPRDAEILCVVGTLYLLSGSPQTAKILYLLALDATPDSVLIQRQLAIASALMEELTIVAVEAAPLAEDALDRLTARLSCHKCPEMVRQISQAASMVDPLGQVGLPESDSSTLPEQMLPALIEQNMRQVREGQSTELIETLRCLQTHIQAQQNF